MKDKDLTLMLHLDSPSREPASPEAAEAIRVAALRGFAPWAVRHSRVAALRRYACASGLSLLTGSVGGRSVSVIPSETPGSLWLVRVLEIRSTGGENLFCSSIQSTFRSRRSKLLEMLNFVLSCSASHKGSLHLLGDSSILPLSSLRFKLDFLLPLLKNIPCLSVPVNASPHSGQGCLKP